MDAPPTNMDTIYTVALVASLEATAAGKAHVPVTCDQTQYFNYEKFWTAAQNCPIWFLGLVECPV